MQIEVDRQATDEPGRLRGYGWRVIAEDGEILIWGYSSGERARAQSAARLAAKKLETARRGGGTLLRRVILDNGHVGLPERA